MSVHRVGHAAKTLSGDICTNDKRSTLIPKGKRGQHICRFGHEQSGQGGERENRAIVWKWNQEVQGMKTHQEDGLHPPTAYLI